MMTLPVECGGAPLAEGAQGFKPKAGGGRQHAITLRLDQHLTTRNETGTLAEVRDLSVQSGTKQVIHSCHRNEGVIFVGAVLITLGFLVAGWAAMVAVLAILDDEGHKIVAALKGRSLLSIEPVPMRPVTVRFSPRAPAPKASLARARIEWRAAA